jgi:hypothetical protein
LNRCNSQDTNYQHKKGSKRTTETEGSVSPKNSGSSFCDSKVLYPETEETKQKMESKKEKSFTNSYLPMCW